MSQGIHIEGHAAAADADAVAQYAQSAVDIMAAAFEYHMDQDTVVVALRGLVDISKAAPGVTGTNISGCDFMGLNPAVQVDDAS